jgi:hypothetical protein
MGIIQLITVALVEWNYHTHLPGQGHGGHGIHCSYLVLLQ